MLPTATQPMDDTMTLIWLNAPEGVAIYNQALLDVGGSYPHYSTGFMESFTAPLTDAFALIYRNKDTGAVIIMPMYRKHLSFANGLTAFDVSSPYGYYGPIHCRATDEDLKAFWAEADAAYQRLDVVAEFIRFNLNANTTAYNGQVVHTLNNIKGRIVNTEEAQLKGYEYNVRKNIKRAKAEGLHTKLYYDNISDEQLDEFYGIYVHTMQRNKATDYFYFDKSVFKKYISGHGAHSLVATTYYGDKAIASELVLVQHDTIYSFLGGTLSEFFDKRPNHLLKHDIINWARSAGKTFFVLGGGYGENDGIYVYKKSFFPNDVVEYFTGRKIVNPEKYKTLVAAANEQRAASSLEPLDEHDQTFFPLYRKLK